MKKVLSLLAVLILAVSMAVSPVCAGGGKMQHENGAADAPGPGDDAQGYQSN
jgi:hypothetical protein